MTLPTRQNVHDRIRRFGQTRRWVANLTLACRLGTVAAIVAAVGLVLLAGYLHWAVNLGVLLLVVGCLAWLAWRFLRLRERRRSATTEAFVMERLVGGLNSRLVAAVDFLQHEKPCPLQAAVIERAGEDLRADFERRLDREPLRTHGKRCGLAVALLVVVAISPWFGVHRMLGTVGESWLALRDVLFPVRYALEPGAGEHVYLLGEEATLVLKFSRPQFETVTLVSQVGEEPEQRRVLRVADRRTVRHTLTREVETELDMRFEFGGRQSEPMTLIFTRRPTLVNMQTELIYPGYTRLLPRTLEGVQPRLIALEGTRLTLGLTFSKELESARLSWDEAAEPLALQTMGRFASTSLLHQRPRQASLQVVDEHGLELEYQLVIAFEVQRDELPRLFLPRHLEQDMPLLPEGAKRFGFGVRAQDDFGVTRCVLKWQKASVDNPTQVTDQGEIERLVSPPRRQPVVAFQEVFQGLGLQPGDRISFQVVVQDNKQPQAQRRASRRCSFFVYQEELAGLNIDQLGFNQALDGTRQRIGKSRKPSVKAPEGVRSRERVVNEHEAEVNTATQAPTVRGEHRAATKDYFELLSNLSYEEDDEGESPARPNRPQE